METIPKGLATLQANIGWVRVFISYKSIDIGMEYSLVNITIKLNDGKLEGHFKSIVHLKIIINFINFFKHIKLTTGSFIEPYL